jgi:hypothetical protein
MEDIDIPLWVGKFFKLMADSGEFRMCQLHEYVSLQSRRWLVDVEKQIVTRLAVERGAVLQKTSGSDMVADLYRFKTRRKRGLVARRHDKHTIDMFDQPKVAARRVKKG